MSFQIGENPNKFFKSSSFNNCKTLPNRTLQNLFPTQIKPEKNVFNVWIKNIASDEMLYEKTYATYSEFTNISSNYQSKIPVDHLTFVRRVDSIKHFATDFFFPTTHDEIGKQSINSAKKIAALIPSILLDLVTMGLRVLTLPYRLYTVQGPETHPLFNELKDKFKGKEMPLLAVFISTDRVENTYTKQVAKLAYALYLSDAALETDSLIYFMKNESCSMDDMPEEEFFKKYYNSNTQTKPIKNDTDTAYAYFNCDKNTPWPEILKTYKKLALKIHPDKNPNNPNAEAEFKLLGNHMDAIKKDQNK